MAMIRGKIIAEVEDTMPLRRKLRVLLWIDQLTQRSWRWVEDLDRLRLHLHHSLGDVCNIELLVPTSSTTLIAQAEQLDLPITVIACAPAADEIVDGIDDLSLRQAIATGLAHDSDYIVVPDELLPYLDAVEEHFHIGLVDPSFLLKRVEVFVRGFDIAWSFAQPVLNQTFNTFYQFSERLETFEPGFTLMNLLGSTKQDSVTVDAGRTLIFNRIANLCYSRDKLLFYSLQREAALRINAKRQTFAQELAYYLNFYYLLLYGAFDHAALVVNGVCDLRLDKRDVGATYKNFLKALESVSPALHAIFTDTSTVELLDRFGALRHYAAHRGSIAPSKLVEKPEREPTDDEVDAYIRKDGQSIWMLDLPESPQKTMLVGMLRSNTRAEILEENTIAKDIVFVEIKGKGYIMHPLSDTTWNFRRTMKFLHKVFDECITILT
jgi:hypothetical protein